MIDTIRFKIITDNNVFEKIQIQSKQRFESNNETGLLEFQIFTKDVEIGSYDYHINIIASRKISNTIFLEFSIPKVFYGHNIYLYYPPIDSILIAVKEALENAFDVLLPNFDQWIIQRLDICYAWKFKNQEEAYLAFLTLNPFSFPRKNKVSFDTSFEEKGAAFDLKGYLKFEEFQKHDFKRFRKLKKSDLAYDFRELARGVFRIELSMRKKKLVTYFKKKELIYTDINNTELLQNILKEHLSKYIKELKPEIMTENIILSKLLKAYKPSKALNLFSFYYAWHNPHSSTRTNNRRVYKNNLNPSSLWRKHHELEMAGIGIISNQLTFDFSIPSINAVNTKNISVTLVTDNV